MSTRAIAYTAAYLADAHVAIIDNRANRHPRPLVVERMELYGRKYQRWDESQRVPLAKPVELFVLGAEMSAHLDAPL